VLLGIAVAPPLAAQMPAPAPSTGSSSSTAEPPLALLQAGRKAEAMAAAQAALLRAPNDLSALYVAARLHQEQRDYDAAIRQVEQMIRHHPGIVVTWEIATQLFQQSGALQRRDDALRQLIRTQAAALDRAVRSRPFIIRDRIDAHDEIVLVQEHFDTGSPDAVRYVFFRESEIAEPRNYLIVRTDSYTAENWRAAGILPPGKRVFLLESVFAAADGRPRRAMHAAFVDLPDYDAIRAKVLEVMAGEAKPMSGDRGGLAAPKQGAAVPGAPASAVAVRPH
jgi:tetratricopeptide (TPR) repeat protein